MNFLFWAPEFGRPYRYTGKISFWVCHWVYFQDFHIFLLSVYGVSTWCKLSHKSFFGKFHVYLLCLLLIPRYGSTFQKEILREDSEIWICVILGQIGSHLPTCPKSDSFVSFMYVTCLPMEPLHETSFKNSLKEILRYGFL